MELMTVNAQWASRPADQRFTSLTAMLDSKRATRARSAQKVVPSKALNAAPASEKANAEMLVTGANGHAYPTTHWSFGQLAGLVGAPAGYLRTLPAVVASDCINYGLASRGVEDVGVLLEKPAAPEGGWATVDEMMTLGSPRIAAMTGPKYGRIWDADVLTALVDQFGDGVTGQFRVPGEFGKPVPITNANTTLFAGDRDMFVFLADEEHRIEVPGAGRDGSTEQLARGLIAWNSEVGSKTFGIGTFLYRYVCCNRIVWGATQLAEIKMRHTSLAPERFLSEIRPALERYAQGSTTSIVDAVKQAQAARIETDVNEFLAARFGRGRASSIAAAHLLEEGRPIATLWDAAQGATAVARSIEWQDDRVALEREAGKLLELAR